MDSKAQLVLPELPSQRREAPQALLACVSWAYGWSWRPSPPRRLAEKASYSAVRTQKGEHKSKHPSLRGGGQRGLGHCTSLGKPGWGWADT